MALAHGDSLPPSAPGRPARLFGPAELALLVVVLAWAGNFSLVKFATGIWDPYAFNLARLAAGCVGFVVAWAFSRRRAPFEWADAPRLLALSLTGHVLFQIGFVHGTHASSASSSALILSLCPAAIAVIAWGTRAEPFCRHTAVGLLLSLAGVVMVSGAEPSQVAQLGNLGLFFAMAGWSVYTVYSAPLIRKYGAIRVCAWATMIGGGVLSVPGLFILSPGTFLSAPPIALLAAAVSGLGAITLAHVLWGFASARVGPTLTGLYSHVVPLPALALSWLWLGEALPATKIAGGALIVAGVAAARAHHLLADRFPRRPAPGGLRRLLRLRAPLLRR